MNTDPDIEFTTPTNPHKYSPLLKSWAITAPPKVPPVNGSTAVTIIFFSNSLTKLFLSMYTALCTGALKFISRLSINFLLIGSQL